MRVDEAFPSKYISAADIAGKTVRVTISGYEIESIGQGVQAQTKPVLYFRGKQKGLVLNKTNAQAVQMMHGPELDDWVGCEIELFDVMDSFQGKPTPAVRVRPVRPQRVEPQRVQQGATERTLPPAPLDDDVPF